MRRPSSTVGQPESRLVALLIAERQLLGSFGLLAALYVAGGDGQRVRSGTELHPGALTAQLHRTARQRE